MCNFEAYKRAAQKKEPQDTTTLAKEAEGQENEREREREKRDGKAIQSQARRGKL